MRTRNAVLAGMVFGSLAVGSARGQVVATGEVTLAGTVETVTSDGLRVRDEAGKSVKVRVQGKKQQGIALADGTLLAAPVEVVVRAEFPASGLKPGHVVRFRCRMDQTGKADSDVVDVTVLEWGDMVLGVTDADGEAPADPKPAAGRKQAVEREVTATVKTVTAKKLIVELPRDKAWNGKTVVAVPLGEGAVARLTSDDPARIEPGARVVRLVAIRLQSGELVARALEVENAVAKELADKGDDSLWRRFSLFNAEAPAQPRLVRSAHFAFETDVSDREWAVISFKLERMVTALEKFLGRPMQGVVKGFVARDLAKFPGGMIDAPNVQAKIRRGEGVCVNERLGNERRATLYSCADHGVIQHECVHGICHLAFGSTGPTWLAEGLAELGNYWREDDQTVDLPAPVVGYLQNATPKRKLIEIAVPGRIEAGTWQDYAWRWALCHLLANNPNYSKEFVDLAIKLMEEQAGASFEETYGPQAHEVSFEYDQFLATLGNGYRSDLTAWPWEEMKKSHHLAAAAKAKKDVKIKAKGGWQAAKLLVKAGDRFEVVADGMWKISAKGQPLDADGEADGRGRLAAAVFADYALTPEIPLGAKATLEPPAAGQLFLRCTDAWTELGDNDGEITVTIRRAP